MKTLEASLPGLARRQRGAEEFRRMLRSWMARSGWSLAVMAELFEQAVWDLDCPGIPAYDAGPFKAGDLVVDDGYVWKAKSDGIGTSVGPKALDDAGMKEEWEKTDAVRRVFPSGLHAFERGKVKTLSDVWLDAFGTLNQWLHEIQQGLREPPAAPRLRERVAHAKVIADADGPYAAAEFLDVYLGRLAPPEDLDVLSDSEASVMSVEMARQIRQGMAAAGLDLVDDWASFVAAYPTSRAERLAKIRDVALGLASWSGAQVRDEEAAVAIALARLKQQAGTVAKRRSAKRA